MEVLIILGLSMWIVVSVLISILIVATLAIQRFSMKMVKSLWSGLL